MASSACWPCKRWCWQVSEVLQQQKRMRPLLGTLVEVGVRTAADPLPAIEAAFAAMAEVHDLLSFHDTRSDLSRLNRARGKAVRLHPLSLRVLHLARSMTHASGGRFNCTVGGAVVRQGVLPDHGVNDSLDAGAAEDIELDGAHARLRRPLLITLDGIAKGYAVDRAIRALRRNGAEAGWVNAGGDLRAFGDLVLPIQRREMDGRHTLMGGLRGAALASSCVRTVPDADFPAWIVGTHAEPGVWSVLASTAWRADALTKVAGVTPPHERAALVRRLGGQLVEAAA